MVFERYRDWYRKLLLLYPKPYREHFGEPMEQTFNDLLQERVKENKNVFGFIMWMCVETSVSIFTQHILYNTMLKSALRVALGTGIFLLLPLYLTLTGSGVDGIGFHWTPGDFVFMFLIIFLPIFLFDQARKKWAGNGAYKTAAGLALLGSFLLLWVNGAVGIIGESDFNMLYVLVVFTLFIGSIVARGKPQGMSYTLFAAAFVQAIIPVIALVMKEPDFSPGVMRVFVLSAFWVMLFVGSGLLFRQASIPSQK